jgi:hypothetical protein
MTKRQRKVIEEMVMIGIGRGVPVELLLKTFVDACRDDLDPKEIQEGQAAIKATWKAFTGDGPGLN